MNEQYTFGDPFSYGNLIFLPKILSLEWIASFRDSVKKFEKEFIEGKRGQLESKILS